nr:hypothetical protein CFP56_31178 [Quercus suber]
MVAMNYVYSRKKMSYMLSSLARALMGCGVVMLSGIFEMVRLSLASQIWHNLVRTSSPVLPLDQVFHSAFTSLQECQDAQPCLPPPPPRLSFA